MPYISKETYEESQQEKPEDIMRKQKGNQVVPSNRTGMEQRLSSLLEAPEEPSSTPAYDPEYVPSAGDVQGSEFLWHPDSVMGRLLDHPHTQRLLAAPMQGPIQGQDNPPSVEAPRAISAPEAPESPDYGPRHHEPVRSITQRMGPRGTVNGRPANRGMTDIEPEELTEGAQMDRTGVLGSAPEDSTIVSLEAPDEYRTAPVYDPIANRYNTVVGKPSSVVAYPQGTGPTRPQPLTEEQIQSNRNRASRIFAPGANLQATPLEVATKARWRDEGITPTAQGMMRPGLRGATPASIADRKREFDRQMAGADMASGRRINEARAGGEIQGGLEAQRGRMEQGQPKAVAFGGGAGAVYTGDDGWQVIQTDNFGAYEKGLKDAKTKGATVHPTNNGAWIVEGDNPPVFVENPHVTKDKQGKTTEKYIGDQFVIKDKDGNPTLCLVWNATKQVYDRKPVTMMDMVKGLPEWPGAVPQGETGGGAGGVPTWTARGNVQG